MSKKPVLKPGSIVPESGQYVIVGSRGGNAGGSERTGVKGKRLPPIPKAGQGYTLADRTKH